MNLAFPSGCRCLYCPCTTIYAASVPIFPHQLAKGYSGPFCQVVKTVNGFPVKNMAHLVEFLRDSQSPFITLQFDSRGGETLVFPRAEMLAATDVFLTDNGVRSQGSPDPRPSGTPSLSN